MKTHHTLLISACCLLLFCGSLHAQSPETYLAALRGKSIAVGKSMSVKDPWFSQSTKQNENIRVMLRWAEDRKLLDSDGIIEIEYTVTLKDPANNTTVITDNISVKYNVADPYTDINVKQYKDFRSATLAIRSITPSAIPEDVILELQYSFDRFSMPAAFNAPKNLKGTPVAAKNELLLTWNFLPGAESYDLEFLFIDNLSHTSNIAYDFANATRINVPTNHYAVSLAYPKGTILYRVRGVGRYLDATTAVSYPVYGKWNHPTGKGGTLPATCDSIRFNYGGLENSLNWQYTAAYAEDGKRKEAITFFDGSLRNRQQVTIGNTQEVAIVAESFYDHVGRAALQTIPAPTPSTGIRYYGQNGTATGNFNGQLLKGNYDSDNGITHTAPLANTTGSSKYYSVNNPFLSLPNQVNIAQVPQAEGYTFFRTRFLNDGTERVHSTASVGKEFGMGSGHETKFYYGNPMQKELDRLFGNEVGDASHYLKRMTIDPNGVATIEYLDMQERVIATSLAGGGNNLLEVDGTPPPPVISEYIQFDSSQQSAGKDIIVSAPGTSYEFAYNFNPAKPLYDTCREKIGCLDCYYKVAFSLTDNESGDFIFRDEQITNEPLYFHQSHQLNIGSYTLAKTVELYTGETEYFWEEFAKRQQQCVSFVPVTPEPCLSECEKYCAAICEGDEKCYQACLDTCGNPPIDTRTECDIKKEILLRDMSPGGQYFDNRRNPCPLDTANIAYDPHLQNDFLMRIKTSVLNYDYEIQHLMHVWGIPAGHYEQLFNTMRENWQDDYARIMLKYHPEYQLYRYFCECGNTEAFTYYDSLMFNTMDPEQVIHFGLMNPMDWPQDEQTHISTDPQKFYQPYEPVGTVDPRFVEGKSCCKEVKKMHELMAELLSHYLTWEENGKTWYASIWYLLDDPDGVAQGNGTIQDTAIVSYITQIQTVLLPQYAEVYGDWKMAKWVFFRSSYLAVREAVMAQVMDDCLQRYDYQYEIPLKMGQQDWYAGQYPEDILVNGSKYYLTADTSLCRNAPLTPEGYQIRYVFNPIYSLNGNSAGFLQQQTQQEVMNSCLSDCETYANTWIEKLHDYMSAACSELLSNPDLLEEFRLRLIELCTSGCSNDPTAQQLIDLEAYNTLLKAFACKLKEYPNYPLIVYPSEPNLLECGCETFQLQLNAHDLTFWSPMGEIIEMLTEYGFENANAAPEWVYFCTYKLYQRLLAHDYDTQVWDDILFPQEFRCQNPNDDWLKMCELNAKLAADAVNAILRQNATAELVAQQKIKYENNCMQHFYDDMTISFTNNEFLFTLYYYDQAGNLIKTVPPRGVNMLTSQTDLAKVAAYRQNPQGYKEIKPGFMHPHHTMVTNYHYNTLNQLIQSRQHDHDGEIITFYDLLARPVISQNARQKAEYSYSYTFYDELGRIIEVGEIRQSQYAPPITPEIARNPVWLRSYIESSQERIEVTRTFYDQPLVTIAGLNQERLRNRIAAVAYYDPYTPDSLGYRTATHYSYDVHGNVQTLVQNIADLKPYNRDFIFIDYQYDLVSGNVNKALFQQGKPEQFIHRYRYDADNRLTHVFTSEDNIIWETEARYFYYPHGALARTELGQKQVQGTDYAYTLQGWTKAVNSYKLDNSIDMGKDGKNIAGNLNSRFGPDAMSYSLQYFMKDYQCISGSGSTQDYDYQYDLFNGNISAMMAGLMKQDGTLLDQQVKTFRYDKLNRIKSMQTAAGISSALTNNFATAYTYDFNGNILSLSRKNETGAAMHNINYTYSATQNRLGSIAATGINSSNYTYDSIGNLIKDEGEGIDITWNTAGKVKEVNKGSSPLHFSYSPLGQRQVKLYLVNGMKTYDYYIHDATGNVMAIYTLSNNYSSLDLKERHIYGSSRLGTYNKNMWIYPPVMPVIGSFTRGQKTYELSNHLGNVNTVISDRKKQTTTAGLYLADIKSYVDYYPFGAQMPGRTWQQDGYRYGFNGQEKDDEIYGSGNSTTAEFWQYDARLGRRWNVDPVMKPWESSYATFANNPVWFRDVFGADTSFTDNQARQDFMTAYNNVNSTVDQLNTEIQNSKNQLNGDNLKKSERKRLSRTLENNRNSLNEWNRLKSDFDNIVDPNTSIITYSSDISGLTSEDNGLFSLRTQTLTTTYADGTVNTVTITSVTIYIRPGYDDYVIHENRHANQFFTGRYNRPTLEIERDAFLYQQIYNPTRISDMINNARILEYQDESRPYFNRDNRPTYYSLDDAIRYIYRREIEAENNR